ncbi:MAG TPA: L-aspartate oxidase [Bryobacteraceae bacterium]|nr:L-aspartate oxidase [Bryobacteraceae bacterium]
MIIASLDKYEQLSCDYLVIGAGVAGLRAAIELANAGRVLVVAKDTLRESSSEYAQGGIAAALSDDDEVELHEQDTLNAGAGLCDREAVRTLVEEGPAAIHQLIEWGAEFDRDGAKLLFAREGAHSRSRVLHSHGDSTGREIARTLYKKASSLPNVQFRSFASITDITMHDGRAAGAIACDKNIKSQVQVSARAVLLATGGLGRVFKETTNPDVATGDGVAAAYRVGAQISDIEFVQFHPTALFVEGAPRFLLSEALRGEGAYLRNTEGERFMARYHEMGELAPRDVVSRSIVSEMRRTGSSHVLLDLTHLEANFVRTRFPRVYETCLRYGVDISAQPAPVHPAAHYSMGGVRTGLDGRTTIDSLYAAGEVACTGVHGANRLASNSLLEGLVFGARAGAAMRESEAPLMHEAQAPTASCFPAMDEAQVRALAWEHCGILRSAAGLQQAIAALEETPMRPGLSPARYQYEVRNMHAVALLIARYALAREESRGGHYRTDFPEPRPEFQKHSYADKDHAITFA